MPGDISWLVPHQANKRIIDATANKMKLPSEKIILTLRSMAIPQMAFHFAFGSGKNKLKKGDNLILTAFGGGFTWVPFF